MALESSQEQRKAIEDRERVIVRFAGDSGEGMQLAGTRFTDATAMFGNDLATLPDFPAEIRAPAGTVGVYRDVQRPVHGAGRRHESAGDDELDALLSAGDTWTVA